MTLFTAARDLLGQLADLVRQLRPEDLSRQSSILGGSTIGQHIRHTLEFFICLESGYRDGVVNYDKRAHDPVIEADKMSALAAVERMISFLETVSEDRPLILEVNYNTDDDVFEQVTTNTFRELVYNVEHAVHHMAMIRIGVREVAPYVDLDEQFGVAVSTTRHLQARHLSE